MRGKYINFSIFLTIFNICAVRCQDGTNTTAPHLQKKAIELCLVCTCSELSSDHDVTEVLFNIQCSELDKIVAMPDLDKIKWPSNENSLTIIATFEGLGLSTLGKLPPNAQVESLYFNNNAIKAYWPEPFSGLPNLKKLSFARNELASVTDDLFTDIKGLEDLDLSYNKLSDFHRHDFKALKSLKRLNLQSNLLSNIPIDTLQNMNVLEDLDLSKNDIKDVLLRRPNTDVFKNIRRLYLNDNKIRTITKESFPDLNSLEFLDISNNIIEIVDEDSFIVCTSLRELNLALNNITFTFVMPASLKVVTLKQNTIHRWPTFPKDITYIDVSYNKLSDWYEENVNFDHLEVLNVAGNQIKMLKIKNKLPKLYSLDLSYNGFAEIPRSLNMDNLPNLEELRLDGNPIHTIYFKEIVTLKSLYMSDLSLVTAVEDKAFSNVAGRSAGASEKGSGCFSLFLSNCKELAEIQDGAFLGTSLCSLDISNNNLTSVSENILQWDDVVDGVNLQWNPWHCGCSMQWVLDQLVPKLYKINGNLLSDLRCKTPRAVRGLRMVHWYNWTEQPMCNSRFMRSGPFDTILMEPSTSPGEGMFSGISVLSLVLSVCILMALLMVIALSVYLIRGRKRYRVRRAAMTRKRQSVKDATNKEQFSALNKA